MNFIPTLLLIMSLNLSETNRLAGGGSGSIDNGMPAITKKLLPMKPINLLFDEKEQFLTKGQAKLLDLVPYHFREKKTAIYLVAAGEQSVIMESRVKMVRAYLFDNSIPLENIKVISKAQATSVCKKCKISKNEILLIEKFDYPSSSF